MKRKIEGRMLNVCDYDCAREAKRRLRTGEYTEGIDEQKQEVMTGAFYERLLQSNAEPPKCFACMKEIRSRRGGRREKKEVEIEREKSRIFRPSARMTILNPTFAFVKAKVKLMHDLFGGKVNVYLSGVDNVERELRGDWKKLDKTGRHCPIPRRNRGRMKVVAFTRRTYVEIQGSDKWMYFAKIDDATECEIELVENISDGE